MNQAYERDIEKEFAFSKINKFYRIGDLIAEGAYGNIFYAQNFDGVSKAIKIIDMRKIQLMNNSKLKQNIDHEALAMVVCDNPHVMKCQNVLDCKQRQIKMIIMDYCDNGSLEDLIYIRGRIPEQEAKIILKQILYGVGDFHRHGLIHRDIKSANFVGKGDSIVLCDFGCSRIFFNSKEQTSHNWRKTYRQSATILGTCCYMSPEMLNDQDYGLKTDLWAIGMVFYEMITGTLPFQFRQGISKSKMRDNIHENLPHIFQPQYISKKLKKQGLNLDPQQCKISPQARKLLSQLLQFSQIKRIGWTKLFQHEYFTTNANISQQSYYEKSGCCFPLKNIPWKNIVQQLKKDINEQQIYQQNNLIANQCMIFSVDKLQSQQKIAIKKKSNQLYENFLLQIILSQQIFFQVRRIVLLLRARQELSKFDSTKIKLAVAISKYCYLRLRKVIQFYQNKMNVENFKGYGLQNLLQNKVLPIYKGDIQDLLKKNQTWIQQWVFSYRDYFRGKQAHNMFKQLINSEQIIEISKILIQYAKKLKLCKSQALAKYPGLRQLIFRPKDLISLIYKPKLSVGDRENWKQWKNLRQIRKNKPILTIDPEMQCLYNSQGSSSENSN